MAFCSWFTVSEVRVKLVEFELVDKGEGLKIYVLE